MKQILKNYVVTATGDLGEARNHANLRKWVEANGGKWASSVTKDCTHLICSKDHWKRQVAAGQSKGASNLSPAYDANRLAVRAARKNKQVKIVTYDWLEDSLQKQSRKHEGPSLWKNKEKEFTKLKAARLESERRILEKDGNSFPQFIRRRADELIA